MRECFVIQPFDGGPFDKRFEDVFEPAIKDAGLEPYRVDRDPRVSIPIDDIERRIQASAVCLADITTDNPNVWFELGYAIAAQKEVVLVCGDRSSKFPFDIQHRTVITYTTDAPRDFADLQDRITTRIKAILTKEAKLDAAAKISPIADVEGLTQHETVCLVSIAQNADSPTERVSVGLVRADMERAGFTPVATLLALGSLLRKTLIEEDSGYDPEWDQKYTLYGLTESGMKWLLDNQQRLVLKTDG